jgi:hypothetical protein
MIKLKATFLSLCLMPTFAWATPQKIEMIFLSPAKVSMLLEQLDKINATKLSKYVAQVDMEHCVPMGDGCFHPQLGYIEKQPDKKPDAKEIAERNEEKAVELKNFNALETNMVSCDKNNYFDIFCGKEKANTAPAEIEVWFDISSSLKTVDYSKDPDHCARRSFIEKVQLACKSKVNVSIYNTSIKQVGENSSVCLSYGMNDQARILRWMKDSKAKHLLIITDIDEMSAEMRSFLESNGAKMTGDGVKAFTANDLIDYAKEFTKMCR